MKKKDIINVKINKMHFGGKTEGEVEGKRVVLSGGIRGQIVKAYVKKIRKDKVEANIIEVVEKSTDETLSVCKSFGKCGGCAYLSVPYEKQLIYKKQMLQELFAKGGHKDISDFEIIGSPIDREYKNKMEFTFGNEIKGGELNIGLHRKASSMSILDASDCMLVSEDYRRILKFTCEFFRAKNIPHYHIMSHSGVLRHLVLRRGINTGQILVNLVTTSQMELDLSEYVRGLLSLDGAFDKNDCESFACDGDFGEAKSLSDAMNVNGSTSFSFTGGFRDKIIGILHTVNDSLADTVQADKLEVLYGEEILKEVVLGKQYLISPFSFFQTNTKGAQTLYSVAIDMVKSIIGTGNVSTKGSNCNGVSPMYVEALGENDVACFGKAIMKTADMNSDKIVLFDLYSGTGTIGIALSDVADEVYSIEIVKEAVEMAKINAERNDIENIEFICGDVGEKVGDLAQRGIHPDVIVLDPPRGGIMPKALPQIIDFGAKNLVYISCNPKSFVNDLNQLKDAGYEVKDIKAVDMFPNTWHVESVVLMSRVGVE